MKKKKPSIIKSTKETPETRKKRVSSGVKFRAAVFEDIRGFFLYRDSGGDPVEYHDLMYKAVFVDHIDIENADELTRYASALIDPETFRKTLAGDQYKAELKANNDRAWHELKMEAVPSFRLGPKTLYAIPGVGVHEEQLEKFLTENYDKG